MVQEVLRRIGTSRIKFNPYDPCVANRTEEGSQRMLLFHVDDLKSSHKGDPKVNDQLDKWLQSYGEHGGVVIHRGKKHDYLGMELDFSEKGTVKIGMTEYVEGMLEVFLRSSKAQILRLHQQAMAYSTKAKERSSMKNVQMHIIRWLQKHYFYASVQDQA
jgi:hypothetical protein